MSERRRVLFALGAAIVGLVNLKTAKAIGVNIPQTILVRAERVIDR